MLKDIKVQITGISPLMMHRYSDVPNAEKHTKEVAATFAAYKSNEGQLFVPASAIHRSMTLAAKRSKAEGQRGESLERLVQSSITITPTELLLGTGTYEIDSRMVVIPATKGRIIRHRPYLNEWSTSFIIRYDDTQLKEDQLHEVVENAGKFEGLLELRPNKGGSYGRFVVTSWSGELA